MAWQGIPFKMLTENIDSVNLAVSAIPDLVLKSTPDYKTAFITGAVSLVAGLIPAGIAVFTFIKNTKTIKDERIEQQRFLKAEREEQQKFLSEERAAQFASMEADRKNQKEIADRSFNMEVLSANRQAWINKLRDLIAEYMAVAPDFLTAQFEFINSKEYFQSVSNKRMGLLNQNSPNETVERNYKEASERLNLSMNRLNECRKKEKLLTGHVKLMLNPEEKWFGILVGVFNEVTKIWNSLTVLEQDTYLAKIGEMSHQMDRCLCCSQDLLKYEWERVKKGE